MGIVLTVVAIPFLIRVFCWLLGIFTAIRLAFSSIDKQEEHYEREIRLFQEAPREYPSKLLLSLKECCEFWIDYWSENIKQLPNESDEFFQELLELQKERKDFWNKALSKIDSEIWQRKFRE